MHNAFYIVQEHIQGITLDALIGKLTPDRAQTYFRGIVQGICSFHKSAGIVHGGIRPQHIIIASNGYAKIAEWGTSLIASFQKNSFKVGKAQFYVAPENIINSNICRMSSDIWALGVTLYSMLREICF